MTVLRFASSSIPMLYLYIHYLKNEVLFIILPNFFELSVVVGKHPVLVTHGQFPVCYLFEHPQYDHNYDNFHLKDRMLG